jgi:hypothetical protein
MAALPPPPPLSGSFLPKNKNEGSTRQWPPGRRDEKEKCKGTTNEAERPNKEGIDVDESWARKSLVCNDSPRYGNRLIYIINKKICQLHAGQGILGERRRRRGASSSSLRSQQSWRAAWFLKDSQLQLQLRHPCIFCSSSRPVSNGRQWRPGAGRCAPRRAWARTDALETGVNYHSSCVSASACG